ncbi:MAG: SIS domain-containing protein [Desulfobacterales bacterium]|nr:SIS domain-containing protein [Desulfobacterales bacterium]
MNHLERIFKQSEGKVDYFKAYALYLNDLLTHLDVDAIRGVIDCFLDARRNKKTIFFAGNGGSAATASHFSQDLGEAGRKCDKAGFKTLSLTDNISLITAIGNDYGYGEIFTIQMAELFCEGDVLVAISASGNSPNIVNAVELAKKMGGKTVGLVGFDGGQLKNLCDHVVHVKSQNGEYGPVEDIHMILVHMITSYLIFHFLNEKENL